MPKKGNAKSKNGQPDKACTVCKARIKDIMGYTVLENARIQGLIPA